MKIYLATLASGLGPRQYTCMPKTLRPCCRKLVIAAALLTALPAIAGEKDYALTVYGGYRGGGHFTDANTGDTLSLESNGAASMALDIPLDAARQYQVFVSYQHTNLSLDPTLLSGSSNKLSMDIGY